VNQNAHLSHHSITFLTVRLFRSQSNRFVDIEAPELPPLADPELFEAVFFENFSSSEMKFMPHYGDALLKAITFDVLSELLGKENFKAISNITPLAISNAFYEQIVLHYGLEKLTPRIDLTPAKKSREITHMRDLLEAYMAAIEKDFSRDGQGYKEVREWLFKVLALRLRRLGIQDGSILCSNGSERHSFTLLNSPSGLAGMGVANIGTEAMESNSSAPKLRPLLTSTTGSKASSSRATDIWHYPDQKMARQITMKENYFPLTNSPSKQGRSDLNIRLDRLRRFVFDLMKQILEHLHTTGPWDVKAFWNTLSNYLSDLQGKLQDESEKILLFYYRVSPH
jgi:hypothetical protein